MTDERRPYRPKRHLRNELYSLALVMAAPLALALVFPYGALSFQPSHEEREEVRRAPAACAFVKLTDAQALAAVNAARSSIRTSREAMRRMRANLSMSEIPRETGCVADISERKSLAAMSDAKYDVLPLPATRAAGAPAIIKPDPAVTNFPHAFSRDDMLSLNDEFQY